MPQKQLTRKYGVSSKDYVSSTGRTLRRDFEPVEQCDFMEFGLDSLVRLGREDLERLGMPMKLKVVIHVIDD